MVSVTFPARAFAPVSTSLGVGAIDQWRQLVGQPSMVSAARSLRDLYEASRPAHAELVFSSACEFTCQHCIYPESFAGNNSGLGLNEWRRITESICADLNVSHFVYAGRSMTRGGAKFLAQLRRDLPSAAIGAIDTGISVIPHLDVLEAAKLNWLDLSFDGTPAIHDRQRNRPGAFAEALAGAHEISSRKSASRLNILTCLTALNHKTVSPMTKALYRAGFRNFFRTPMAAVLGVGPNPAIAIGAREVADVAVESLQLAEQLQDAYVELGVFDPEHFAAILKRPEFGDAVLTLHDDHVAWTTDEGSSTIAVRFWPASLTGMREFIVNSDGRVLLPKAMAWGRIPDDMVIGHLLSESAATIWQRLPQSSAFTTYVKELETERRILGELLG